MKTVNSKSFTASFDNDKWNVIIAGKTFIGYHDEDEEEDASAASLCVSVDNEEDYNFFITHI